MRFIIPAFGELKSNPVERIYYTRVLQGERFASAGPKVSAILRKIKLISFQDFLVHRDQNQTWTSPIFYLLLHLGSAGQLVFLMFSSQLCFPPTQHRTKNSKHQSHLLSTSNNCNIPNSSIWIRPKSSQLNLDTISVPSTCASNGGHCSVPGAMRAHVIHWLHWFATTVLWGLTGIQDLNGIDHMDLWWNTTRQCNWAHDNYNSLDIIWYIWIQS